MKILILILILVACSAVKENKDSNPCGKHCADCEDICWQSDEGYFTNDNNRCHSCSKNCLSCSDQNSCDECKKGYYFLITNKGDVSCASTLYKIFNIPY